MTNEYDSIKVNIDPDNDKVINIEIDFNKFETEYLTKHPDWLIEDLNKLLQKFEEGNDAIRAKAILDMLLRLDPDDERFKKKEL